MPNPVSPSAGTPLVTRTSRVQPGTRAPKPDAIAPDGSHVFLLAADAEASSAQFVLSPGAVSRCVAHHTITEHWYVVHGSGQVWRANDRAEETTALTPGTSLNIPTGTRFQFRNDGADDLVILGVTIPPWPGDDEAYPAPGKWRATL